MSFLLLVFPLRSILWLHLWLTFWCSNYHYLMSKEVALVFPSLHETKAHISSYGTCTLMSITTFPTTSIPVINSLFKPNIFLSTEWCCPLAYLLFWLPLSIVCTMKRYPGEVSLGTYPTTCSMYTTFSKIASKVKLLSPLSTIWYLSCIDSM